MFFRWVELSEVRPQEPRLPVFLAARGNFLLLHVIFHAPNFGAIVARSITNDHHFENRIIGGKIEFVMQLPYERTQLFEKSRADEFEVRLGFASARIFADASAANALKIAIQAKGFGIGRNAPFGGAKENGYVRGIDAGNARRDRVRLDGLINGGKNDGVLRDMNDD